MSTLMKNQIKILIEESVEEIFRREMRNLYASLLPYVSKAEQKNIEKSFKNPSNKYVRSFTL